MEIGEIRVAKIIESDKIVINKGSQDYITESMEFLVYDEGEDVVDPITKKSLGALENPKGTFKVVHIQQNMTILVSKLKRPNKIMSSMLMFNDVDIERDMLRSIHVGDKVKITNQSI